MTTPSNPGDARPTDTVDANQDAEIKETRTEASDGDRYLVKCPWSTSVFRSADKSFPDITPSGTEMSGAEKDAAKAAAKTLWLKLTSSKVGDN